MTDEEKIKKAKFIRAVVFEYIAHIITDYETEQYKESLCDKYNLYGEDRGLFESAIWDFSDACKRRAEKLLKESNNESNNT